MRVRKAYLGDTLRMPSTTLSSVDPATRQPTTCQEALSYCSVAGAKSYSFQLPTTEAPTITEGRAPCSKVSPSTAAQLCSHCEMLPACSHLLVAVALCRAWTRASSECPKLPSKEGAESPQHRPHLLLHVCRIPTVHSPGSSESFPNGLLPIT